MTNPEQPVVCGSGDVGGSASKRTGVKPLSDAQIEKGWEDTFSTNNPFCPCDLRSFMKAVRWAERACYAAAKARA